MSNLPQGDAIAWGSFSDVINKTGWAVLDIHTVPRPSARELNLDVSILFDQLIGREGVAMF